MSPPAWAQGIHSKPEKEPQPGQDCTRIPVLDTDDPNADLQKVTRGSILPTEPFPEPGSV